MTIAFIILQIQEQAQAITGSEVEITLPIIDLVLKGGWIMGIIGFLSVVAFYIFFERYFIIGKAARQDKNFMNNIRTYIHEGKIESAKVCHDLANP